MTFPRMTMNNVTDVGTADAIFSGKVTDPMVSSGIKGAEFINLCPSQLSHAVIFPTWGITSRLSPTVLGEHIAGVVFRGAKEEVVGPDTRRVITTVEHPHTFGNRTIMEFVRQAMRGDVFPLDHDDAVSGGANGASPQPTIVAFLDTGPEVLVRGTHFPMMPREKLRSRANGTTATAKTSIIHSNPPEHLIYSDIVYRTSQEMSSGVG